MPVLPLIDLMILLGSLNLGLAVIIRAIAITTHYRLIPLGLGPIDFVVIAVVCFVFALTLAARTWVKLNEPLVLSMKRYASESEARRRALEFETGEADGNGEVREKPAASVARIRSQTVGADPR